MAVVTGVAVRAGTPELHLEDALLPGLDDPGADSPDLELVRERPVRDDVEEDQLLRSDRVVEDARRVRDRDLHLIRDGRRSRERGCGEERCGGQDRGNGEGQTHWDSSRVELRP